MHPTSYSEKVQPTRSQGTRRTSKEAFACDFLVLLLPFLWLQFSVRLREMSEQKMPSYELRCYHWSVWFSSVGLLPLLLVSGPSEASCRAPVGEDSDWGLESQLLVKRCDNEQFLIMIHIRKAIDNNIVKINTREIRLYKL